LAAIEMDVNPLHKSDWLDSLVPMAIVVGVVWLLFVVAPYCC